MPKKTRAIEPSYLVLPMAFGRTDDFELLVDRVREFVRLRETVAGPWLFDPAEHSGLTLWEWNATTGFGDSCRDAQVLDEYVEVVFAYDPISRTVGCAPYRPSVRSVLSTDSVIVNQVLSFITCHLSEPGEMTLVRSRFFEEDAPDVKHVQNVACANYGGATTSYSEIGYMSAFDLLDDDALEDLEDGVVRVIEDMEPPADFERVGDWLDLLTTASGVRSEHDVPLTATALHDRLDELHRVVFESWGALHPSVFSMTVEALLARVIERTNTLRRLYGKLADEWPELPALRLAYPTASVTMCLGTPELARIMAESACERCDGCSERVCDRIVTEQLRLAV